MSELTTPIRIDIPGVGSIESTDLYLKSEVDKVIAELKYCKDNWAKQCTRVTGEVLELKAQKAQAEDDCAYWKMREGNAANATHETEEYAMQLYKQLRHANYKRCLAMADNCEKEVMVVCYNEQRIEWLGKWKLRWLELAEKFKEVK